MSSEKAAVFFYGLFMDESLLAAKGIRVSNATVGHVNGYGLRIGERATLVPEEGNRAYGVLMTLRTADLTALYAEASVADYIAEAVSVVLPDGTLETADCYNLPANQLKGANSRYASSLLALAGRLGFPRAYREQIRNQVA